MKKLIVTVLLTLALALTLAVAVSAVSIGGINYTLTKGTDGEINTAKVDSHKGKTFTVTDIVIPEYVEYKDEKYYVTSLSSTLFEGTNITTVDIQSQRITVIPEHAFKNCQNLTSVIMPDSIEELCGYAFNGSSNLKLNPVMPASLKKISGSYTFQSCSALEPYMVFPSGLTSFTNDTGLQSTPVKTLIFKGEMTAVRMQYFSKLNVYFLKNSVNDLNGNFVDTQLKDGVPYYTSKKAGEEKAYTEVTGKTLTITAFSGTGTNSTSGNTTDANGNTITKVTYSQDRLYFCEEGTMCYLVRNSSLNGTWTSYFAPFETDSTKSSQNRAPHFKAQATYANDSCYAEYYCMCCGEYISKELSVDAPGHVEGSIVSLTYENGFSSDGKIKYQCSKCDTKLNDKSCDALFSSKGYSQDTTSLAIVLDIDINLDAIALYEEANETEVIYGITASYADQTLESCPLNDDLTPKSGAACARFDGTVYTRLRIKITNITDASQGLYCCGFVAVNDKISYISGATEADVAQEVTYENCIN